MMIKAYKPLPKFPSISITGAWCALNCKYCQGKVLNEMIHVNTPTQLYALCKRLKERHGIVGCLISGGFTKKGKLPIKAYLPTIKEIKKKLDLIVSVHVGVADKNYAEDLRSAGVDIVDLNLLDPQTMTEVMNLKSSWKTVEETLKALQNYGPPFIAPHILIGAYYGEIRSEYELISMLKSYNPYIVVMLILLKVKGTPFELVKPPEVDNAIKVFEYARKIIPKADIALGCMRPRGEYGEELELKLLSKNLLDRIVIPSTFKPKYLPFCCSLPKELEDKIMTKLILEHP
ncbi:MAG: radical SAM protein [Candidatus Methanomethylicota archaeon]|uniref:Radical SAM protein n=1 Tax=Thermoproteota archaeon TaxID=2056631 RepID=A0A497F1B0_9CREN|nr:MAG: radical SAM protein [Candidatus Verstraetearchaeota archaeon]